jgi:hypothetical protein
MRTRSFSFFCVPEEMPGALAEAFERLDDMSIFTESDQGDLPLSRIGLEKMTADRPKVLWIAANGNQPESFLGLIRLFLPRYKNNALCMSSIAIKADSDDEKFALNLKLFEQLKKLLRQRLKPGLWGANTVYGGEHFYRNYYISDAAISQFRLGRELAPEGGDRFVRFEYRDHDTGVPGDTIRN